MAANLKKAPNEPGAKRDEKAAPKLERERFTPDMKWVALGMGLILAVVGSTFLGVHFYAKNFLVKTKVVTEFVDKRPPKPGPSLPLFATQIVNLKGGRFLRFSVVLQYEENDKVFHKEEGEGHGAKKGGSPVEAYEALMKDVVSATISRHSADELLQPRGREALKEEVKTKINDTLLEAFDPAVEVNGHMMHVEGEGEAKVELPRVLRVFFTEFVVS